MMRNRIAAVMLLGLVSLPASAASSVGEWTRKCQSPPGSTARTECLQFMHGIFAGFSMGLGAGSSALMAISADTGVGEVPLTPYGRGTLLSKLTGKNITEHCQVTAAALAHTYLELAPRHSPGESVGKLLPEVIRQTVVDWCARG